ncbi:MAG: hypothetical protein U0872_09565 [Planctomycetaceae bacterium]
MNWLRWCGLLLLALSLANGLMDRAILGHPPFGTTSGCGIQPAESRNISAAIRT